MSSSGYRRNSSSSQGSSGSGSGRQGEARGRGQQRRGGGGGGGAQAVPSPGTHQPSAAYHQLMQHLSRKPAVADDDGDSSGSDSGVVVYSREELVLVRDTMERPERPPDLPPLLISSIDLPLPKVATRARRSSSITDSPQQSRQASPQVAPTRGPPPPPPGFASKVGPPPGLGQRDGRRGSDERGGGIRDRRGDDGYNGGGGGGRYDRRDSRRGSDAPPRGGRSRDDLWDSPAEENGGMLPTAGLRARFEAERAAFLRENPLPSSSNDTPAAPPSPPPAPKEEEDLPPPGPPSLSDLSIDIDTLFGPGGGGKAGGGVVMEGGASAAGGLQQTAAVPSSSTAPPDDPFVGGLFSFSANGTHKAGLFGGEPGLGIGSPSPALPRASRLDAWASTAAAPSTTTAAGLGGFGVVGLGLGGVWAKPEPVAPPPPPEPAKPVVKDDALKAMLGMAPSEGGAKAAASQANVLELLGFDGQGGEKGKPTEGEKEATAAAEGSTRSVMHA